MGVTFSLVYELSRAYLRPCVRTRVYTIYIYVCALCNYRESSTEALRNRCESFFIDRVKAASELCVIHCLLGISFAFYVEPRANLRLSEMLLRKFRVATTETGSFMRA